MAIQYKSKIAAEWNTENPVLAKNELVLESDTGKIKIGDGIAAYTDLPEYGANKKEFLGTVTTLTVW